MDLKLVRLIVLAVSALLVVSEASAYVDPGSGHLFLQMILAGLLGALFYLKSARDWIWYRISSVFTKTPKNQGPSLQSSKEKKDKTLVSTIDQDSPSKPQQSTEVSTIEQTDNIKRRAQ